MQYVLEKYEQYFDMQANKAIYYISYSVAVWKLLFKTIRKLEFYFFLY